MAKMLLLLLLSASLPFILIEVFLSPEDDHLSPYAGQQTRAIKSLSPDDIAGLRSGAGTPLGGMAKAAELNGYPGPRHVLDAYEDKLFSLTPAQHAAITTLHAAMREDAIAIGRQIIAYEQAIDAAFADNTATDANLSTRLTESARLGGQLRHIHLRAHLAMVDILTPDQIEAYNALRGYGTEDDPCASVPEGHSARLWRRHNHCDD